MKYAFVIWTLAMFAWAAPVSSAWACGCFAQSSATTPVIQAGERIIFARDGDQVEMHVQVRYSGNPREFAWLLPVPQDPELSTGSDAFFDFLDQQTRPIIRLFQTAQGDCFPGMDGPGFACGAFGSDGDEGAAFAGTVFDPGANDPGVVLRREQVGPFDARILDASDLPPLFEYLEENRYWVEDDDPESVLGDYVGPGRRFVALKLAPDVERDDLRPLVLKFDAAVPSIPIRLTRVGAEPDMPVLVWVLGPHRAIARNYRHAVVNFEHLNWFDAAESYGNLVTAAVDEAPEAHAFVTEFSGSTTRALPPFLNPSAYDSQERLQGLTEARSFLFEMERQGFVLRQSEVQAVLRDHVPFPEELQTQISQEEYYRDLRFYAERVERSIPVDGTAAARDLWERVVVPQWAANSLLRQHETLTRMLTTLSPHEMTLDPTFDFNPDLPPIPREHTAQFTRVCNEAGEDDGFGWLELPDGRRFYTSPGTWSDRSTAAPFSRAIQVLGLEGPARTETDNMALLTPSDPEDRINPGDGGCRGPRKSNLFMWALIFGAFAWLRRSSSVRAIRRFDP